MRQKLNDDIGFVPEDDSTAHPRSALAWAAFVRRHRGPGLRSAMAVELRRQGTTVTPNEILAELVLHNYSLR